MRGFSQTLVLYPKARRVSRQIHALSDYFHNLKSVIIQYFYIDKGGNEMDIDDLIYGDADPGPSSR